MTPSQIYVAVVIIIIFIAMLFIGNKNSKPKRLSLLASIAFGFIVAGIVFGENRIISYSLFILGIILSVVDAYIRSKK
ncbi:MAG: hypothetical protein H6Q58_519 [Firmicutes bacterium]|nr:hypothetical protein [Bacillota bacterium]